MLMLLVPAIAGGAESMSMVQIGISGAITTPGIILAGLTGNGEDSVLVGTSTGLYVFTSGGDLHSYIQTSSSVTNVAVLGDLTDDGCPEIAISTADAYFPNVQCYDIETGEKIWEFSPKTEVYDSYILWTMQQTSVFDMVSVNDLNSNGHDDIVLSSGYGVYALDGETGEPVWEFEDSDNVWDLLAVDDQDSDGRQDILAGDQNGYLYMISGGSGEEIWSKYLSKTYTVINPSTNSLAGSVKRSVWDIIGLTVDGKQHAAVSAEDGYVYLIDIANGDTKWQKEIIDYVDTLLYSYYGDHPLPTSMSDYNFFNLRVNAVDDATGDGNMDIIASAFPGFRWGREYKGVAGLYLLDSGTGEIEWSNENIELGYTTKPACVELDENYLAVPVGKSGTKDKVKLINPADGSSYETVNINSTSGQARGNLYFLLPFGKDRFIIASSYGDLVLVEYPDSVVWSYPRINDITIKKADFTGDGSPDMLVKSRDGADTENPFDEGLSRIIFVIEGATREIAWSYALPSKAFSATGGLAAVQAVPDLNKDGKSDVVAYLQYPGDWNKDDMYGELTRILAFSGKNGMVIVNRSLTEYDYYGVYNHMFKDDITLNQTIRDELLSQRELVENDLRKMSRDERKEFDRNFNDMRSNILDRKDDFRIIKRIESLDIIQDQSGDGVPDFIIGGWNDVFIMDSVHGDIIWNRTQRPDHYQDPFTGEFPMDIYHNWTVHDRGRLLVAGDASGDGMDDLVLVDWDGMSFLHSNITAAGLDYYRAFKFTTTDGLNKERVVIVGDLNGNGAKDLVFEQYIQDSPPLYTFLDGRNGYKIMEVGRSGTSAELGAADFDGNGFDDSIIFQIWSEAGKPKLEIVDGRTKETVWSYKGIEEAWMLRDVYGYNTIMPAAPAGDLNGDGVTDVAVARSQAWQPGAEVLVYNAKSNQELKRVVVEEVDKTRSGDSIWMPGINAAMLADINGDGKNELGVIMAVGEAHQKEIKMFVVDVANGEVIADFTNLGSEIINLGNNSVGMIGTSGNIYFLDTSKDMSISTPETGTVTGSPVSVEWKGAEGSMATIFVDNKKTLITGDKKAGFEILSGEHKITVYSFDRYGKGVYDSVLVNVAKSSSSAAMVLALVIVLLAGLFIPKIYTIILKVLK